jgi:undecaprenyl-diphosphatase
VPALSRRTAGRLLVISLGLFVLCTAMTAAGMLGDLDHSIKSDVAGTYSDAGDVVFSYVALTASLSVSVLWLALLALAVASRPRRLASVLLLAVLLVAALGLELLLKVVVDHPGPGPTRAVILLGGSVEPGSFPSGHMIRGTALAIATALLLTSTHRRAALGVAAVYIAALAWTRVYLNEHWASDVIGGFLLGLAAAAAVGAAPRVRWVSR